MIAYWTVEQSELKTISEKVLDKLGGKKPGKYAHLEHPKNKSRHFLPYRAAQNSISLPLAVFTQFQKWKSCTV